MAAANPPAIDTDESDSVSEASDESNEVIEDLLESERNVFKEPWKGSDVVLLVEERKFHVHKTMLSLNSPVFDAMFNKKFKESLAGEVLLPGKKATEFLEFLLQLYPQTEREITINNVGQILNLADEYQTNNVTKSCETFLRSQGANGEATSILEALILAQRFGLEEVRSLCCIRLQNTRVEYLSVLKCFDDLDIVSLKEIILPRMERLENCLADLFPQVIRLTDFGMSTYQSRTEFCVAHNSRSCTTLEKREAELKTRLKNCTACREMLNRVETHLSNKFYGVRGDKKLFKLLLEMYNLLGR